MAYSSRHSVTRNYYGKEEGSMIFAPRKNCLYTDLKVFFESL